MKKLNDKDRCLRKKIGEKSLTQLSPGQCLFLSLPLDNDVISHDVLSV